MAVSVLSASSVPKLCSNAKPVDIRSGILNSSTRTRVFFFQPHEEVLSCRSRRRDSTRLNMGLSEIEPDLNEDPRDRWATNSVHPEPSGEQLQMISRQSRPRPVFKTEYLYIGAALFTVVFCIIEMDKPDKPHNFEPQIYNMEPGARDKLIADYNTMDIWDFNEKYGDLWDFTVKKDDITKR
ncbi:hypothetical protein CRG98_023182 [Punica granatum]|uniref:Photosynthetic NDH subunit of subcomplex B 5, chloroplastic n=1 Tax=Punica granatum TaxID=22663 RepID=A0A2I0JJJ5_PUNGR|nr:hypothetical protein CRG98_023182 [Punica granatum]